jgi:phosphatidylserine decarboxylase
VVSPDRRDGNGAGTGDSADTPSTATRPSERSRLQALGRGLPVSLSIPDPLPPLAPGVGRFALPPLVAAILAAVLAPPVGAALVVVGLAVVYFFRDPPRAPDGDGREGAARADGTEGADGSVDDGRSDGTVLAPCDGEVSVVRVETDDAGRERLLVGTFMSPLDVHVVRAPLSGRVEAVDHDTGGHWPAFTKAAERNERLSVTVGGRRPAVERDDGAETEPTAGRDRYDVTLITGALARRVTPYVRPGDDLTAGARLGHIAFGSRTDVRLPPTYGRETLCVAEGDTVRAGETVIARLDRGREPAADGT